SVWCLIYLELRKSGNRGLPEFMNSRFEKEVTPLLNYLFSLFVPFVPFCGQKNHPFVVFVV
ncbi:MAG: hypothetical protein ACYS47_16950, partial [Planctomycetota bacterium]